MTPELWAKFLNAEALHTRVLVNQARISRRQQAERGRWPPGLRCAGVHGGAAEGVDRMLVLIRGAGDLATGIAPAAVPVAPARGHDRPAAADGHPPHGLLFAGDLIRKLSGRGRDGGAGGDGGRRPPHPGCRAVSRFCADPQAACRAWLRPDVLVDAILAKKNLGTQITDAPLVIGVGPGFCAGRGLPRGHRDHARPYARPRHPRRASPFPNTNIPGLIGGFTGERVLRAPDDGIFHQLADIGTRVQAGDVVGEVNGKPMACTIAGVIRGMLADGTPVYKGMKSGDVDPRGELSYCSDRLGQGHRHRRRRAAGDPRIYGRSFECHGTKCMGGIIA